MKQLCATLLMVAAAFAHGQPATMQAQAPTDPLAPVAWLVGGTWRAEVQGPANGGGTTKIEMHAERTLNGKAVRFATSFNSVPRYEGFFAYDAVKKAIVFAYPSAAGDIVNGAAEEKQDYVLLDFIDSGADGTAQHYQVHLQRKGNDDYDWTLFQSQQDKLTQLLAIHYHRDQ